MVSFGPGGGELCLRASLMDSFASARREMTYGFLRFNNTICLISSSLYYKHLVYHYFKINIDRIKEF